MNLVLLLAPPVLHEHVTLIWLPTWSRESSLCKTRENFRHSSMLNQKL